MECKGSWLFHTCMALNYGTLSKLRCHVLVEGASINKALFIFFYLSCILASSILNSSLACKTWMNAARMCLHACSFFIGFIHSFHKYLLKTILRVRPCARWEGYNGETKYRVPALIIYNLVSPSVVLFLNVGIFWSSEGTFALFPLQCPPAWLYLFP